MTKLDRAIEALQEAILAYEDLPVTLQDANTLADTLRDQIMFLSDLRIAVKEMQER